MRDTDRSPKERPTGMRKQDRPGGVEAQKVSSWESNRLGTQERT